MSRTYKVLWSVLAASTVVLTITLVIATYSLVRILNAPEPRADGTHVTVKAVCDYTRVSDESEQACVEAMKASGTEYLCADRNSLQTNICWVEDNPQATEDN